MPNPNQRLPGEPEPAFVSELFGKAPAKPDTVKTPKLPACPFCGNEKIEFLPGVNMMNEPSPKYDDARCPTCCIRVKVHIWTQRAKPKKRKAKKS